MASPSYLVIGAGVFGASTAYHLSKTHPESSITLMDRSPTYPCKLAASYDLNKIIRADYTTHFYMRLALKALQKWNIDPLWKPYFHQTGMCVFGGGLVGGSPLETQTLQKNYDEEAAKGKDGLLPNGHGIRLLKAEDFQERFKGENVTGWEQGAFSKINLEGIKEVFYNPASGWGDATLALEATIKDATERGVKYVEGTAIKLLLDPTDNHCIGVRCSSGLEIRADRIILCTAAGTPKLLANSFPPTPEFQPGDRLLAAGALACVVKLTPEQYERYKDMPVIVYDIEGSDIHGEMHPPGNKGLIKFTRAKTATDSKWHENLGRMLSSPPEAEDEEQWDMPEKLRAELRTNMMGIAGWDTEEYNVVDYRVCWDSITPNQDHIICPHPASPQNLFLATGGSFHSWKFLPVIGEYVIKMMEGTLDEDEAKRWAWDRPQEGGAHSGVMPDRELRDMH